MTLNDAHSREIGTLRKLASAVIFWLIAVTMISLGACVVLLSQPAANNLTVHTVLLCVVGGTLGSSVSALVSAAERISNGWELSSGDKYPTVEPKDKFVARMVPFFIIRPLSLMV
jgi:hypothetical protein